MTQIWHGRFSLNVDMDTFTIDDAGGPGAVEAIDLLDETRTGDTADAPFYIAGYTAEATSQLCEFIQEAIRTKTGYTTATCSFDFATGKVTLGFNVTTSVTWGDSALRDLLGYTGNLSGSTSYVAPNEAQYVWRPNRKFSLFPADGTRLFAPESTTTVFRSRDGTISTTMGTLLQGARNLEYEFLAENRVVIPASGTINQEFEQYFRQPIHDGAPHRIYPDATAFTATDFITAVVGTGEEMIGEWTDFAERNVSNFNGLWSVSIPVLEFK
jgi:hypothetical protein